MDTRLTWSTCMCLVVVTQMLSKSLVWAICPFEECSCTPYTDTMSILECDRRGLDRLPVLRSGYGVDPVDILVFNDNNITEVPAYNLPTSLTYLDFSDNPITHVSPEAFLGSAKTLNTLVFDNAKFTKLPEALLTLTNLTDLFISHTPIAEWNTAILSHLGRNLRVLLLTDVGLTQWPTWIDLLPSLTTIVLENDSIQTIPDNAFTAEAKNKLQSITLNYLGLQEVPKSLAGLTAAKDIIIEGNNITLLENIPSIERLVLKNNNLSDTSNIVDALLPSADTLWQLSLGSNQLTTIPDFSKFSKLGRVDLSENAICNDTTGSFPQSVTDINLAKNCLSSIPSAVANASNVTDLDLSLNGISEITPDSLPDQLVTLDLSSNNITNIDFDNFPQHLSKLELQDNAIDTFAATSLSTSSSLTDLNLDGNPIASIPIAAFQSLQQLERLSLSRTKLTEIPVALISLTSLSRLDMRDISNLNCTCPTRPMLAQWFASKKYALLAFGSCNNNTLPIDMFFADYYCSALNRRTTRTTEDPDKDTKPTVKPAGNIAIHAQCHWSTCTCIILLLCVTRHFLTGYW